MRVIWCSSQTDCDELPKLGVTQLTNLQFTFKTRCVANQSTANDTELCYLVTGRLTCDAMASFVCMCIELDIFWIETENVYRQQHLCSLSVCVYISIYLYRSVRVYISTYLHQHLSVPISTFLHQYLSTSVILDTQNAIITVLCVIMSEPDCMYTIQLAETRVGFFLIMRSRAL
jgi:hypothetical protein